MAMITSAERASLMTLIRARERVAIADAREYSVTLMAEFERKLATIFKPEDHPIWQEAHAAAKTAVEEAMVKIKATFSDLGIPPDWAPGIAIGWYGRGENASIARRVELRRVAAKEVERRLRSAEAAIKKSSVETQTRIIASGLTSDAAQQMLAEMPSPQQLLPELSMDVVEKLAGAERMPRMIEDITER